jgi:tripartite-type tricarboxylate transporter receptor subunit TctC
MQPIIRVFAAVTALLVAPALATPAAAQKYPAKPVKMIVPFAAGGVTDIVGRIVAQGLSEKLGQQFYIENHAGAGGNIGMANAAKSAGDGYTILIASSSIVVNPSLYNKVPYDITKDFIPVTKAGGSPNAWMVHPSFPAKTMQDLIAMMKKEPGKVTVGSPGTGTTPSLSIDLLRLTLNLDFVTVPFSGGGPMTQALLGNHTPVGCGAIGNSMNLINEGKLRALAVTSKDRLPGSSIPTLAESGIKDQEAETMTGVFVPAGTPKEVVALLQKEISAIVNEPKIKARMLELGVVASGDSSEDFTKYVKDEVAKWKGVIEKAHIKKI